MSDFKFVVEDHDKVEDTIGAIVGEPEKCFICGGYPIVIVYRGWDDKIVMACKKHEEIVLEMIERARI